MLGIKGRAVSWRVLLQIATVGAYTGVVKIAGGAKVVLTARAFGMSDGLDAYLIAFLLPSFLCDTLAGPLNSAFVPTFIEVRERDGPAAAHRLYQSALAAGAGLLSIAAILSGLFAPWILKLLASSFNADKLALTCSLFWVMLPIVPLTAFTVIWRSVLNTEARFAIPAVLPALTPVASIVFLLLYSQIWGVYSLALGTLAGGIIEIALLAVYMVRRGLPVLPHWHGWNPALHQAARQYGPVIGGIFLLMGAPLIDQGIAGMLGPGSVSALNYGTRLSVVLMAIGPAAVATAILPHFSELTVSAGWEHVRQSLRSYTAIILAITLPAIAILMIISEPLVRLSFEHGQFTGADTPLVTAVQRFSLLAIPSSMAMALVLRLISSMKANFMLLRATALYAILNLALDFVLTRWIGIQGIPLSMALVQLVCVAYLWRRLHREFAPHLERAPEQPIETR
ncbi:MAG TPA: lipid II flippase MurJ [Bryobacteraceae bacterium]|jgi:putative peptidoglycan lipid II flippase|nr:lipid II flippase MurJ [Bryobacteraceae bacterium]